jgi:hypothetical protein
MSFLLMNCSYILFEIILLAVFEFNSLQIHLILIDVPRYIQIDFCLKSGKTEKVIWVYSVNFCT